MRRFTRAGLERLRATARARRLPPLSPDQMEIVRRMRVEDHAATVDIAAALGTKLQPVYDALRALGLKKLGGQRQKAHLKICPRKWIEGEAERAMQLRFEGNTVTEVAALLGRTPPDVAKKLTEIAAAKVACEKVRAEDRRASVEV